MARAARVRGIRQRVPTGISRNGAKIPSHHRTPDTLSLLRPDEQAAKHEAGGDVDAFCALPSRRCALVRVAWAIARKPPSGLAGLADALVHRRPPSLVLMVGAWCGARGRTGVFVQVCVSIGPFKKWPRGHRILTLSSGPSVDWSRYGSWISAGSPHRARPRASRYAGQSTNLIALVSMKVPVPGRPRHPPSVAGAVLQAAAPDPRRLAGHMTPADR